jgi:hypothetical protein
MRPPMTAHRSLHLQSGVPHEFDTIAFNSDVAWRAIADRTALNQPDPMADQPLTTWDSLISR